MKRTWLVLAGSIENFRFWCDALGFGPCHNQLKRSKVINCLLVEAVYFRYYSQARGLNYSNTSIVYAYGYEQNPLYNSLQLTDLCCRIGYLPYKPKDEIPKFRMIRF